MVSEGAIYRIEDSGNLFEVVDTPDFGYNPDDQVELRRLKDDEWYGVFHDNFRSAYEYVAESEDEL